MILYFFRHLFFRPRERLARKVAEADRRLKIPRKNHSCKMACRYALRCAIKSPFTPFVKGE
jgi:hypothetical protein